MNADAMQQTDYGKRYCLACGGALDKDLMHVTLPAPRVELAQPGITYTYRLPDDEQVTHAASPVG